MTTDKEISTQGSALMQCPIASDLGIDLFADGSQEHWFEDYQLLHNEAPISRIPGGGWLPGTDAFVLTKFEDIARITRDPLFSDFSPGEGSAARGGSSALQNEIFEEAGFGETVNAAATLRPSLEQHKRYRQELWDPWVGPMGADQHREMVEKASNKLIDQFINKGEVEFVTEFAAPLPQTVITTILGFPLEDMPTLKKMEEAQVRRFVYGSGPKNELPPDIDRENASVLVDFHKYIQGQVDIKRKNPQNDMISWLSQTEYEGRELSDGEIIIATLVCLMAVDANIGKEEYQTMLDLVSPSQPDLEKPELLPLLSLWLNLPFFLPSLFFLPFNLPLEGDATGYFWYANDIVLSGRLPTEHVSNISQFPNNGWPIFLSTIFTFIDSNNFRIILRSLLP